MVKGKKVLEMKVSFYENADDSQLKFAVIISKSDGKWVMCRHKDRTTYEIPGGHREDGETIIDAAIRELKEETGAKRFVLKPVCVYSVSGRNIINPCGDEAFGMLYCADIEEFESELHNEIESVKLFEEIPRELTYPLIQPKLIAEAQRRRLI